jgi:pimeloyl-ACP methyl ester carboxylesterase
MIAMTEIAHHRINVGEVALHYVTAGSGPPLVLIHGFPQTWHEWRSLIDRLAGRFTIIAPDLRGIGARPGPSTGYDKHSLAADVRAIVAAECGDTPALVCGHDLGAFVAFAYALDNRDATAALALVDGPPPGTAAMDRVTANPRIWHIAFHAQVDVAQMLVAGRERAYIRQFVNNSIVRADAIGPDDIDIYADAYAAPGALRAAFEMYRALPEDRELNLTALARDGKLDMPVLTVGSGATAIGASLGDVLAEIATDGRAEVLPCGHWIPEEEPDALAALLVQLAAAAGP